MALTIDKTFSVDLAKPINVRYGGGLVFTGDAGADTINVHLYKYGEEYLPGGSVALNCIRADGNTVTVAGTVSGNVASATLTQACCAIPGPLTVVMQIVSGGNTGTVFAAAYTVMSAQTGSPIDPGTIIPDIAALIAEIDAAIDSIPADYSDLLATIAPDYSQTTYSVGDYVWHEGELFRCTTAIATGESWNSAHWTAVTVGGDLSSLRISVDGKVDIAQGVAHAGEALIIGDDGNVTTGEAGVSVDTTLSIAGKAADAKVTGDAITEIDDALFTEKAVSMANADTFAATANANWGFYIPDLDAEAVIVKPKFNVDSGTYTATRWHSETGTFEANEELTLVDTKTANIGDAVRFDNVTDHDFFAFISSVTTDKLRASSASTPAHIIPLGRVSYSAGLHKYIYTSAGSGFYFAATQLDVIERESALNNKLDKNQGSQNAGKAMIVGSDGSVEYGDYLSETDDTLRIAGDAADSKAVGDILLNAPDQPLPDIIKGYGLDANGAVVASYNDVLLTDYIMTDVIRMIYIDSVGYPETPGYLSVQLYMYKYESDGTFISYGYWTYDILNSWQTIARNLQPGYKYRFSIHISNYGTFTTDEIIAMAKIHWKTQNEDDIGLVTKVSDLEGETERITGLETDVYGGGTHVYFPIEKGNINATTGADENATDASSYGRSIGYYAGGTDNLVISVPVGGRCLVFEYSSESASGFIRTIYPPNSDGIKYINSPYTLTTESGKYYRFTFLLNDSYQWQDGSEYFKDFTFIEQSTLVDGLMSRVTALEQESGSDKLFTGKTCVTLGDSITYRNVWQPVVNDALGMTMVNKGIGSTCLAGTSSNAMCSDTRLSGVLAESPDYVTVLGGANDLVEEIPIGTEAEFSKALAEKDKTTFLGAYSYIVEYLLGHDPTLNIMILGTTWAHSDGTRYSETLTYTDYSNASKLVAQYYGLPFVDLHGECGFNAFTMGSAVANQIYSSDQIHPNAEGGKRIASLVIAKMIEAWKYTL